MKASVCFQGGCQGGSHDGWVVWVPLCAVTECLVSAVTGRLFCGARGVGDAGTACGWARMYVRLGTNSLTHQPHFCQVQPAAVTTSRLPPPFPGHGQARGQMTSQAPPLA